MLVTATLTLPGIWLNLASDLSVFDSFDTTEISASPSRQTDVRRYANGRLRLVTRAGSQQQVKVNLAMCTRAQVLELEGWVGTLLCLRDQTGRTFYGAYGNVSVSENGFADYADVSFTFTEVTVTEGV